MRNGAAQALVKNDLPQQTINGLTHYCLSEIGGTEISWDALSSRPGNNLFGELRRNRKLSIECSLNSRFKCCYRTCQAFHKIIGIWLYHVKLPIAMQGKQIDC